MPRKVELTVLVIPWDDGYDLFVLDPDHGLLFRDRVHDTAAVEPTIRARLRAEHPDRGEAELTTVGP